MGGEGHDDGRSPTKESIVFTKKPSQIFLEPIQAERDGTLAICRIGQTMVCPADDVNLFWDIQIVKDSQGLIHWNKFILFPVNHQTI